MASEAQEGNKMKYTYVFAIYLGINHDDLVEIVVQANNQGEAESKVKMLLHEQVDTQVTGLYLNDYYKNYRNE